MTECKKTCSKDCCCSVDENIENKNIVEFQDWVNFVMTALADIAQRLEKIEKKVFIYILYVYLYLEE